MREKAGIAERFLSGYIEQDELMVRNSPHPINIPAGIGMLVGGVPLAFVSQLYIAGKWVAGGMKGDPIGEIEDSARARARARFTK